MPAGVRGGGSGGRGRIRARQAQCLRCYGLLDRPEAASEVCPHCGFTNLAAWRRVFWTREPRLVRIEWAFKAAIAAAMGGLTAWATLNMSHLGTGAGWFLLIPALAGIALWFTASKTTQHVHYFNAGLLWSLTIALIGCIPLMAMLGFVLFGLDDGPILADLLMGILIALPFLLPAWGIHLLARRLERWKRERLKGGPERSDARAAGDPRPGR